MNGGMCSAPRHHRGNFHTARRLLTRIQEAVGTNGLAQLAFFYAHFVGTLPCI